MNVGPLQCLSRTPLKYQNSMISVRFLIQSSEKPAQMYSVALSISYDDGSSNVIKTMYFLLPRSFSLPTSQIHETLPCSSFVNFPEVPEKIKDGAFKVDLQVGKS